jgi:hypothetical protein
MTTYSRSRLFSAFLLVFACGGDDVAGTASGGNTETGGADTTTGTISTTDTTTRGEDAGHSATDGTGDTTGPAETTLVTGEDSTGYASTDESDGSTGDGSTGDGSTGDGSTGDGSTGDGSTGDEGSSGETTGGGVACLDHAECQDGSYCNGEEQCVNGFCTEGTAIVCNEDDGIACTVHACSEGEMACVHEPDDNLCPQGETCSAQQGCISDCVEVSCVGTVYECGDCIDNDGDGLIDMNDPNCWGPCDNNEAGWKGEIPGQQNQSTCLVMDCYFDHDSGQGPVNPDDCYWSHTCDPLEPMGCSYNPNTHIPGANPLGCADLEQTQSDQCHEVCGPLVPNGCDCFGCCEVTVGNETYTVYLGTEDGDGEGTCSHATAADEEACHPCTQVTGCLNPCEECELCIGKNELPANCDEDDQCPNDEQPCGLDGQDPCSQGSFCLTGCCQPIPQ